MTKAKLSVEASDEILMQIFNQIDQDGSRSIDRVELVNFLKHADFNLTAVAAYSKNKTVGNQKKKKTMAELHEAAKL